MTKTRFSLESFRRELDVPAAEHAALAGCFTRALAAAEQEIVTFRGLLTREQALFRVPRRLGYLGVEVVRDPALSPDTKLKAARYVLQRARPLEDHGTPRGLLVLLSFLAGAGVLDMASFTACIKLAEIDRSLFDDVRPDELGALLHWLVTQPDLDDRQRLWWLWYLTGNLGDVQLGRAWLAAVLEHPGLATEFKRRLCDAWLSPRPPGPAPQAWQALDQALSAGLGGGAAEPADPAAGDLDGPLLALLDDDLEDDDSNEADDDDFFASLGVVSHLMRGALGGYVIIPHYVERRAVLGLAEFGDDPQTVCELYLDASRDEGSEALNQGVADILRAFHDQMPAEAVRALVEKGLTLPQVSTRKTFYALAADLYGPDAWQRARQDNAASVRAWAEGKATKDERR